MEKEKIDIKDKNENDVFFGDKFLIKTVNSETVVTVVKDLSPENIECDRNYDVEDEEGNRIWNAYMVIRGREKIV